MATKFSSITWEEAESQVRQMAGAGGDRPPADLFREMSNIVLMYVNRLLEVLHEAAYRKSTAVTVRADVYTLQKAEISALVLNVASATGSITAAGSFRFEVGDRLSMWGHSTTESEIAGFRAVVTQGGATGTLMNLDRHGATQDYVPALNDWATGAQLVVVRSHASQVVDLGNLHLKRLVGLYDAPGGVVRQWDRMEREEEFRRLVRDRAYDKRIAYLHRGPVVELYVGKDADAITAPVVEYDSLPALYTLATKDQEIELFHEYYRMWADLMEGWVREWISAPVDPVLEGRINQHLELLNGAMRNDALTAAGRS